MATQTPVGIDVSGVPESIVRDIRQLVDTFRSHHAAAPVAELSVPGLTVVW